MKNKKEKIACLLLLLTCFFGVSQRSEDLNFSPSPNSTTSCNNLKDNFFNSWLPTHGSPSMNDNKLILGASLGDAPNYNIKSEGVVLDVPYNINIGSRFGFLPSTTYRITISYENLNNGVNSRHDMTFRAFLTKDRIIDNSSDTCEGGAIPSINDTKEIYYSNNQLEITSENEERDVVTDFIVDSDEYRYLWIYSDYLKEDGKDSLEDIKITNINIKVFDTNFYCESTVPTVLGMSIPTSSGISIIGTSKRLAVTWGKVDGSYSYQYQYRKVSDRSWSTAETLGTTSYFSVVFNEEYAWRVRSSCSPWYGANWTDIQYFTVTTDGCLNDLTIIQDVTVGAIDTQSASETLIANNTINNGASANYYAGESINLKAGFRVHRGGTFESSIQDCYSILREKSTSKESKEKKSEYITSIEPSINLYPNPFDNELTISSNEDITNLQILSLDGKVISSGKTIGKLNAVALPTGIYILRASLASGNVVRKKIIKK